MLDEKPAQSGGSQPEKPRTTPKRQPRPELTARELASLSRFGCGEWIPDAQVERLQELGLVEKIFGQALLTRLGRTTLGLEG